MFKNCFPLSSQLFLTGESTQKHSVLLYRILPPSSESDGEHPPDVWGEESSGDDLLRPAQRRSSGWRVSGQGPEHSRLSDHGAHLGLLRPAAGRT